MNVMDASVRKAGRSLARDYGAVAQLQVSLKGPGNFVSAADMRSEEILYREDIKTSFGYAIVGIVVLFGLAGVGYVVTKQLIK